MTSDRKRLALEVAALLVVVSLIVVFATRDRGRSDRHVDFRFMMGTIVSVTVLTPDQDAGPAAIEAAFREVARVESLTTRYSTDSEIARLNTRAGGYAGERVSPEVVSVVARSLALADASSGAFDITVAPLVDLWSFPEGDYALPEPSDIAAALERVGWSAVSVDTAAGTLTVRPGTELDLAGVAKGYAVDRGVAALEMLGIGTGVVDAGGDVGFVGTPPDAAGWRVGIKHPRGEGLVGVLLLDGGSVATSGDYQHYFTLDGVRYHHLLDPSTGYPAHGAMSVTVAAERCIDADALATAVFVLGPERGMALVESLPGAEALIIEGEGDVPGEVLLSSGLEGRFDPEAE